MNIVLIVIDTVRRDFLSPYRGGGFPTVHLERFAEEGTLYTDVISPAPWTTPVHASLFTGLYPSRHGTHGGNLSFREPEGYPTLMRLLRGRGYRCVGISANYLVSEQFGFAAEFDEFIQAWQVLPQPRARYHFGRASFQSRTRLRKGLALLGDMMVPWRSADAVRSAVNRWYERGHNVIDDASFSTRLALKKAMSVLRPRGDSPLFLFINLMQAHEKYNPPEEVRARLGIRGERFDIEMWRYYAGQEGVGEEEIARFRRLYSGEILYLDQCLGGFFAFLKGLPSWDETVVAVLSDHGELLGEHGMLGHLTGLFQILIHVPLMVKYPAGAGRGGVDRELRQSQDLFATFLELAGAGPAGVRDSVSLLGSGRRRAISQLVSNGFILDEVRRMGGVLRPELSPYAQPMMGLVRDGWKYVFAAAGDEWLYDLEMDGGEERNRIHDPGCVRRLEGLRGEMKEVVKETGFGPEPCGQPLEEEVVERLRAMGYV